MSPLPSQMGFPVLWRRQGHSRSNETRSINVFALTDTCSKATAGDVGKSIIVANGRHVSADLAKMRSAIAEDRQLHSLEFRQVHCDRLDFRRFCPVESGQYDVRHRARILIECRYSRCFASHAVGPRQHYAQTSLINRKPYLTEARP